MDIRRMTQGDCPKVRELYVSAWREGYKGLLPREYLDKLTAEKINCIIDEGSFVALDGERIAAHCHARAANEPKMRGWGEIHTMYTHPDYWRRGFGAAVFGYAERWLFENGFNDVYLYVLEGNERAERFYKAQGFLPNLDTLCCEIGGVVVTDNRFTKHYPRSTRCGDEEIKIVESGAAAIAEVLKNGDFKRRDSLLLCLDRYFDPYYKKNLPEREKVAEVLREYEKIASDSTLFTARSLLAHT